MKRPRKQYTSEEKVAILRKHLLEREPVSDVCDEYGLQPTVFYRWQKQLFEQGAVVVFSCLALAYVAWCARHGQETDVTD